MRTDDARAEILRAIRRSLESSPPVASPPSVGSSPPGPLSLRERGNSRHGLRDRFTEQLTAVGARWTVVRGEADAGCALARVLTEAGARRVALSDAPLVRRLLPALEAFVVEDVNDLSRDALFACDAGVTTAQWGIAETGTLVLESAREASRLLSLVPPLHVALLSADCLCESMGDALARVRQVSPAGLASHAITFITGPSRTSDIELTLVVGVHGPATVHVLLLEDA